MKEEWRTIVVDGKEHLWYSVSNLGNIVSHLRQVSKGNGGSRTVCNPNVRNLLKTSNARKNDYHQRINLKFPLDFFEDYKYQNHGANTVNRKVDVHKLVMEAFRPMDEYPPDKLKDCWDDIPEVAKNWIKETVIINHKDHDPTNNCVDNLEYTTPKGNSRAAVEHYGGNVANKNIQRDGIEITYPHFDVLFQEWVDGKIEFVGEEGEEVYNMLVELNKDKDETLEDTFFNIIKKYDQILREGDIK